MDGQGNIEINTPKNITFTAGMNHTKTARMKHSCSAGAMMMQNAVADYTLMTANIMEMAQGKKASHAGEITEQGIPKQII